MRIQRPHYLNKLIAKRGNGRVKVITGVRRCGKSFLLFELFKDYLKEDGVSGSQFIELTLEDAQFMRYRNPLELDKYLRERIKKNKAESYVFIDEIQFVEEIKNPYLQEGEEKIGFVDVLLGIMKLEGVDVYITGSNSKMLSTDINTQFRGRNDEIQVFPLSFSEFCSAYPGSMTAAWEEYSIYGGMPAIATEISHEEKSEYLRSLVNRTYLQDIINRNNIRHDESVLFTLLQVLASTAGSPVNPTRIANTFKSERNIPISANTIEKYLKYFEEAFFIRKANRYDVKGNKYISTLFKCYFVDPGIRNAILNFRERDEGFVMENIIYIELVKRGYNVDTGSLEYNSKDKEGKSKRTQLEIDFVVNRGSKRYYIQAALDVATSAKQAQETNSLNRITDSFKKIVIVKDNVIPWQDNHGITYTGVERFLSREDFLDIESVDSLIDIEGIQKIQHLFADEDTARFVWRKLKTAAARNNDRKALDDVKRIVSGNGIRSSIDDSSARRLLKEVRNMLNK